MQVFGTFKNVNISILKQKEYESSHDTLKNCQYLEKTKASCPLVSSGEAVAYHLEFVKKAKHTFTNWSKTRVNFKGLTMIFFRARKPTSAKFQIRPFG